MSGQSAQASMSSVKSVISEIKTRGGVTDMETSVIGGSGRKGGAAEGPDMAPHHNIASEFMSSMGGEATTGTTGYNSGYGKTT
jgi:hypothetical protein